MRFRPAAELLKERNVIREALETQPQLIADAQATRMATGTALTAHERPRIFGPHYLHASRAGRFLPGFDTWKQEQRTLLAQHCEAIKECSRATDKSDDLESAMTKSLAERALQIVARVEAAKANEHLRYEMDAAREELIKGADPRNDYYAEMVLRIYNAEEVGLDSVDDMNGAIMAAACALGARVRALSSLDDAGLTQ